MKKKYIGQENYQALLWYIIQAGDFLREMATHQAERYTSKKGLHRTAAHSDLDHI